MAGTILENLSTRKMLFICALLFLLEVVCILVGAIIAPQPSLVHNQYAVSCNNKAKSKDWILPKHCIHADLTPKEHSTYRPEDIVFALKIPKGNLEINRLFQFMLTLMTPRSKYHPSNAIKEDSYLTMDIRVGYTNSDIDKASDNTSEWTELFRSTEKRKLDCITDFPESDDSVDSEYLCEPIHFFQLGSTPHRAYLVNVKFPTNYRTNHKIGRITELEFATIMQTGGFTKVWASLKCVMFVLLFFPIIWYWNRIQELDRPSTLLERVIFGLSLSMQFLNLPLELVTMYCDAPWMLLVTDLRQGLVYVVLLCFWIIFIGQHLMDQAHRNKLWCYKYQLSSIIVATTSMLMFELCERGTQIVLPSATIWTNRQAAYVLLVVGAIAAAGYIVMLVYLIFRSVRSIRYKRRFSLTEERRKRFERIVKRFYTLLFITFLTATVTVFFFFFQQALGSMMDEWFDVSIQPTSGFFTGVYGMWNIYVTVVLWLYAPSHKVYEEDENEMNNDLGGQVTEQIQLMSMAAEKQAED